MQLQARLHEMLTKGEEIPAKAAKSVERQLEELIKAAEGQVVLLVLDGEYCDAGINAGDDPCTRCLFSDMWSREHAKPFDCVDPKTESKFLVRQKVLCSL